MKKITVTFTGYGFDQLPDNVRKDIIAKDIDFLARNPESMSESMREAIDGVEKWDVRSRLMSLCANELYERARKHYYTADGYTLLYYHHDTVEVEEVDK